MGALFWSSLFITFSIAIYNFKIIIFTFYVIKIMFSITEQRVASQLFARWCVQALACIILLRISRILAERFYYIGSNFLCNKKETTACAIISVDLRSPYWNPFYSRCDPKYRFSKNPLPAAFCFLPMSASQLQIYVTLIDRFTRWCAYTLIIK